ncbi:hypothetical protein F4824DRAFT_465555 [Ustulina deusta]|nr:hypothetical protein F4824DRAFT_465555 [Ustulina deusta]
MQCTIGWIYLQHITYLLIYPVQISIYQLLTCIFFSSSLPLGQASQQIRMCDDNELGVSAQLFYLYYYLSYTHTLPSCMLPMHILYCCFV